jgi:WhiB family transcriptional regulator, redox-sensing transcriptional regulator
MCWPGTTAVAPGVAGLAGQSAQPVTTAGAGERAARAAMPAGGTGPAVTLPVLPRTRHLPCMGEPDLFFAESPGDVEAAKALCRGCPVRLACLSGARERREPWGVWGGELFLRGQVVPRKRPRGRPRKTDVAA